MYKIRYHECLNISSIILDIDIKDCGHLCSMTGETCCKCRNARKELNCLICNSKLKN